MKNGNRKAEDFMKNDHAHIQNARFRGIEPFQNKIWLSSPTMHGDDEVVIIRLKLEQTA